MDSDLEELLLFVQEDEVLQSGTIPDTQCLFGYKNTLNRRTYGDSRVI